MLSEVNTTALNGRCIAEGQNSDIILQQSASSGASALEPSQTDFDDWKAVVVNDGSTDSTCDLIGVYPSLHDPFASTGSL